MRPRPAFAISLYVTGRKVVVVGDGPGASRRARELVAAGADVVTVAAVDHGPGLCLDAFLVMAQTGDPALDRRVVADARAAGCLCYAHDQPDISDLAMPAVARRGALTLAISTDATAPALARRLREELQALLDGAGEALDRLWADMSAARAVLPSAARGERLRALARRLRLHGRLVVDAAGGADDAG